MEKRVARRSIRQRMSGQILLILGLTYITIVLILVSFVRVYFFSNFYNNLKREVAIPAEYYEDNIGIEGTLTENLYSGQDSWWRSANARVQIYDTEGALLMDSQGILETDSPNLDDVSAALAGETGSIFFRAKSTGEHVMSAAMPLRSTGRIVGVIRYIASVRQVDNNILRIGALFFLIGGLVAGIAVFMGLIMTDRIVTPILGLTKSAREMARGNYNVRSQVANDDEIGELAQTFNYMVSEIKKKEALKNDFISSVSHELRTPLTAIKGWAITLKDPATDRELLDIGLDIIETESDRLKGMVDELLDFSKFVAGKVELKLGWIDPNELKGFVDNFVSSRTIREKKTFSVQVMAGMKPFWGDENRIKQVLINLVDNAFKFTEPGDQIRVEFSQTEAADLIIVHDTGIGIDPADLEKVTEKFYKGKHAMASSGIGLSIAQEIVQLHGGSLTIESQLDEYTRMIIKLPKGGSYEAQTK